MRAIVSAVLAASLLTACMPSSLREISRQRLADEIANAIGGPATCLLLANRQSGRIVWASNLPSVCDDKVDLCVRKGLAPPKAQIRAIREGLELAASCPSSYGPGREVGWAGGVVNDQLIYVAVMEGDRALPGMEMQARLAGAFRRARLTD